MMRWTRMIGAALVLCVAATALAAAKGPGKDRASLASGDLKALLQGYENKVNQAFKDKDTATFLSYVDPNASAADPTGLMSVSQIAATMKDEDLQTFTIEDYKIQMINPSTCVATFVWKGTGSFQGQPIPAVPVYCSTVWAKKGKDWKAYYHQETPAAPAPASTAPSH